MKSTRCAQTYFISDPFSAPRTRQRLKRNFNPTPKPNFNTLQTNHDICPMNWSGFIVAYRNNDNHNGSVTADSRVLAETRKATNGPLPPMRVART
jgi:hypothetical protein